MSARRALTSAGPIATALEQQRLREGIDRVCAAQTTPACQDDKRFLQFVTAATQSVEKAQQRVADPEVVDERRQNPAVCRVAFAARVKELLERHACELEAASAVNYLSTAHEAEVAELLTNRSCGRVDRELELCAEPSSQDGCALVLAALRRC